MYWTENIMLIMMMFKNNNPNHLDYVGEIIHQDRQSLRKQCCHHWTNWIALLWPNYYLPFRFKWNLIITILMTLLKHLLLILLFSRFASFQWMGNICFEEREKYTLPERPLIRWCSQNCLANVTATKMRSSRYQRHRFCWRKRLFWLRCQSQ